MTQNKQSGKTFEKPGLRMNELMAATGLPRSTLVHWIKEELLIQPIRKNRTMAYYHPDCVERAAFVSEMQNQGLSLTRVKKLLQLKDKGLAIDRLVKLHQAVLGVETEPLLDKQRFCEIVGIESYQIDTLIDAELLLPEKPDLFNQEDVTVCSFYLWGFSEGMKISDLKEIQMRLEEMVDSNMALSARLTEDMPDDKAVEVKLQLINTMSGIQNYLGQRLFHRNVKERARQSVSKSTQLKSSKI